MGGGGGVLSQNIGSFFLDVFFGMDGLFGYGDGVVVGQDNEQGQEQEEDRLFGYGEVGGLGRWRRVVVEVLCQGGFFDFGIWVLLVGVLGMGYERKGNERKGKNILKSCICLIGGYV